VQTPLSKGDAQIFHVQIFKPEAPTEPLIVTSCRGISFDVASVIARAMDVWALKGSLATKYGQSAKARM
jgi:hypothetical protein